MILNETKIALKIEANSYTIEEANSQIDSTWLSYIEKHPNALIYHHPAWLNTLERETCNKVIRLVCKNQSGEVVGVIPLQLTKGVFGGIGGLITSRRLSCLPRTPLAGVLTNNNEITHLLVNRALQETQSIGKTNFQLKSLSSKMYDSINDLVKIPWRESYLINLPANEEDIKFGSPRNHRRIKWAVNKAKKSGLSIRYSENKQDLKAWYKLYLETCKWHSTFARSFSFFENLWDFMQADGLFKLMLAEVEINGKNKIIAGSIFLMFNRTVFYAFNGRNKKYLSLRPNDFIQWYAIHQACREGYSIYDIGEVSESQVGLANFKAKWGCDIKQIYHYYYPSSKETDSIELESGYASKWRRLIWHKIPLNVTAKLGTFIYKYL